MMTSRNKRFLKGGLYRLLISAAVALGAASVHADSLQNYQVLKYLESSGTQAIDTGIKYGGYTRLVLRMQTLNGITDGQIGAIDACTSGGYDRFHFNVITSNNAQDLHVYPLHYDSSIRIQNIDGAWHEWDIDKFNGRIFKDASSVAAISVSANTDYTEAEDNHSTLWLFGRNSNTTSLRQYAKVRISTAVIMQEGTLVRQLIPCRRLSDDELGMYDLVRREFLTNIGTGSFTAGPAGLGCVEIPPQIYVGQSEICPTVVINNAGQTRVEGSDYTVSYADNTALGIGTATITGIGDYADCGAVMVRFAIVPEEAVLPGGYQRVAWLESTKGGGQVIDTLVHPTGGTRMEIFFQAPRLAEMKQFGVIHSKGNDTYERFHFGGKDDVQNVYAAIGTWVSPGFDYTRNWTKMTVRAMNGRGYFSVDDTMLAESDSTGAFSPAENSTIWLFGRNSNVESLKRYSACRLMYADIREGDSNPPTLTHRLVPCRRIADGELGVYDTVANQFLYDTGREARGAAAFVAGPDVGSGSRPGLTIFVR